MRVSINKGSFVQGVLRAHTQMELAEDAMTRFTDAVLQCDTFDPHTGYAKRQLSLAENWLKNAIASVSMLKKMADCPPVEFSPLYPEDDGPTSPRTNGD